MLKLVRKITVVGKNCQNLKMEEFEWNVYNETKLFEAMVDHKPVGVNKHFQMVLIWNKLQDYLEIPSDKIWSHLETLYNMEALDDIESLPFPNDEKEFHLPDAEYAALKAKKEEKVEEKNPKTPVQKKVETKEVVKVKQEVKKDDRTPNKKEVQRRDSKDGKDPKTPVNSNKKELRKDTDKKQPVKGKTNNAKEDDKLKTPKSEDLSKRINKRPTRGSMKPDESPAQKSQSPITVTPTSAKRRRI